MENINLKCVGPITNISKLNILYPIHCLIFVNNKPKYILIQDDSKKSDIVFRDLLDWKNRSELDKELLDREHDFDSSIKFYNYFSEIPPDNFKDLAQTSIGRFFTFQNK